MARSLLDCFPGFLESRLASQYCAQFPVADKIKWLRFLTQAAIKQRLHFAHPALFEHSVRSGVNAFIEFFAHGHQSNFQNAPAFERDASGTVHGRYRLARKDTYFDRADELLFVRRRDFSGRLRVEPLQNAMEMARGMLINARAEPLAQFF